MPKDIRRRKKSLKSRINPTIRAVHKFSIKNGFLFLSKLILEIVIKERKSNLFWQEKK